MAEGGVICAQVLLTIFNFLQFLIGWVLIIVGAVIKVNMGADQTQLSLGVAIFLIVIGCILVVVSLIGCFGTWAKNFCLLVTFCVFTSILFVLVVIALSLVFFSRGKSDEVTEVYLMATLKLNDTRPYEEIQAKLQCCGVNIPEDWDKNPRFEHTGNLPGSCCAKEIGTTCPTKDVVYREGCLKSVSGTLKHSLTILGGIAIGCAIVTFLVIFSAAYMAHVVRGSYNAI